MHSPAMWSSPMDRTTRSLGELIALLDNVAHVLDREEYIELRRRMVCLYLDSYYVARKPYDRDDEET